MIANEFSLSTKIMIRATTIGDLVDQYIRLLERTGPISEESLFDKILVDYRTQISKQFDPNEVVG